jgi:hypothetical protein
MGQNHTKYDKIDVECDQIILNAMKCMFCPKCGTRVKTNFIRNRTICDKMHVKCDEMRKNNTQYDKMHVKCDEIKQNATKDMFCQKCGIRVNANFIRIVMKYDRFLGNVTITCGM